MTNKSFTIQQVTWEQKQSHLSNIREQVFIQEQHVPPELEWDENDQNCIHLLAVDSDDKPIGTARMLSDGHIGRMAVLPGWRNQGVGSAMLKLLVHIASENRLDNVFLFAQTTAIEFYRKHQFNITSKEFMDAGILHRQMDYNFSAK